MTSGQRSLRTPRRLCRENGIGTTAAGAGKTATGAAGNTGNQEEEQEKKKKKEEGKEDDDGGSFGKSKGEEGDDGVQDKDEGEEDEDEHDDDFGTASTTTTTTARWASCVWRRGTVPVWWRSEARAVGDAGITVRAESPYAGCDAYLGALAARFGEPVALVSLLRAEPGRDEAALGAAYAQALRSVRRLLDVDVALHGYDWHAGQKRLGAARNVEALWAATGRALQATGFAHGTAALRCDARVECGLRAPDGRRALFDVAARQTGVLRYNCADSLDRTNIASFYVAWHLLAEMGRRLHLPLLSPDALQGATDIGGGGIGGIGGGYGNGSNNSSNSSTSSNWPFLGTPYKAMLGLLKRAQVLPVLADFFVATGDVCSVLYTNSPASHAGPIRELSSAPGAIPSNAIIAIQRRYQNVVHDRDRQLQYELFCGVPAARRQAFPSYSPRPLEIVSKYPATCLSALERFHDVTSTTEDKTKEEEEIKVDDKVKEEKKATEEKETKAKEKGTEEEKTTTEEETNIDETEALLDDNGCEWRLPDGTGAATLVVVLARPCEARALALTLASSEAQERACNPRFLSVRVGAYRDRLRPVLHRVPLPAAPRGTRLVYALAAPSLWAALDEPPAVASSSSTSSSSQPHPLQPQPLVTRVVELTLSGPRRGLVLGNIAVYGRAPPADASLAISTVAAQSSLRLRQVECQARLIDQLFQMHSCGGHGGHFIEDKDLKDKNEEMKEDGKEKDDKQEGEKQKQQGEQKQEQQQQQDIPYPMMELPQPMQPDGEKVPERRKDALARYEAALAAMMAGGERSFDAALELEQLRLASGVTAGERDQMLVCHDAVAAADPQHYCYARDERLADAAARAALPPTGSSTCQRCRSAALSMLFRAAVCAYCRRRVCSACRHPHPLPVPEYCWPEPRLVCRDCAARIERQQHALHAIAQYQAQAAQQSSQQQASQQQQWGLSDPAWADIVTAALQRRTATSYSDLLLHGPRKETEEWKGEQEQEEGEENDIAEFPEASLLDSVPCAPRSSPAEVVLVPAGVLSAECAYWAAPAAMRTATLTIALPRVARVTAVALVAGPRGWTAADLPRVTLTLSNAASGPRAQHFSDTWDLRGEVLASGATVRIPPGTVLWHRMPKKCPFVPRLLALGLELADGDEHAQLHLGRVRVRGVRGGCARPCETPEQVRERLAQDRAVRAAPPEGALGGLPCLEPLWVEEHRGPLRGTIDIGVGTNDAPVPVHGFVLAVDHTNPASAPPAPVTASAHTRQMQEQEREMEQQEQKQQQQQQAHEQKQRQEEEESESGGPRGADDEGSACQVRLVRVTVIATTQAPGQAQPCTTVTVAGKFLVPRCRHGTSLVFRFAHEPPLACSVLRFEYLDNYGASDYTAPGRLAVF